MTTKEFLTRARARIEGQWTKRTLGDFVTLHGDVCAVGGMLAVLREEHPLDARITSERYLHNHPCINELLEIGKELPQPSLRQAATSGNAMQFISAIEAYNDHPTRTEPHVLKLFDSMINKA